MSVLKIHFYKYQGTGNDFVMLDNREGKYTFLNKKQIAFLCDRRFGIGADGLILLENESGFDFKMVYFNSDGSESTMCGNGGRCAVAFAKHLGIIDKSCSFVAIDGPHRASVLNDGNVSLQMKDVDKIETNSDNWFLNTGSPHYVELSNNVNAADVYQRGREIRYSERFKKEGTNVNLMEFSNSSIKVRTYERGVENETLSCGTGVTACALVASEVNNLSSPISIEVKGGNLKVYFTKDGDGFKDIYLEGPAVFVFEGDIDL